MRLCMSPTIVCCFYYTAIWMSSQGYVELSFHATVGYGRLIYQYSRFITKITDSDYWPIWIPNPGLIPSFEKTKWKKPLCFLFPVSLYFCFGCNAYGVELSLTKSQSETRHGITKQKKSKSTFFSHSLPTSNFQLPYSIFRNIWKFYRLGTATSPTSSALKSFSTSICPSLLQDGKNAVRDWRYLTQIAGY